MTVEGLVCSCLKATAPKLAEQATIGPDDPGHNGRIP